MGIAGALIMPSTLSIIINVFPGSERPKAIAIWASVTGAAGALGPVASGFLLGHFWFGSVFLVNVPIIIIALVAGKFLVPKSRDPEESQFDPMGAVLSFVGIVSLVYGLIEAPDKGWLSVETLAAFTVAIVVLSLFVAWELHTPEPMLDMRYFRRPAFSTGTGGMILVFVAMYGVMFLITQYFQLVLGYSALSAALRFMPIALIMLVVAPLTPRLSVRFGAHRRRVGRHALIATGLLLFTGSRGEHRVHVRRVVRHPADDGHRAVDVADDGVDHVGGSPAPRGRRLRDERRDARTRRRTRDRRARQHRRVALRQLDRAGAEAGSARPTRRGPSTSIAGALHVASTLPAAAGDALTSRAQQRSSSASTSP